MHPGYLNVNKIPDNNIHQNSQTCSLTWVSRPSMVVNWPPSVPSSNSNSSSGTRTAHVSDYNMQNVTQCNDTVCNWVQRCLFTYWPNSQQSQETLQAKMLNSVRFQDKSIAILMISKTNLTQLQHLFKITDTSLVWTRNKLTNCLVTHDTQFLYTVIWKLNKWFRMYKN